MVVAGVVPSLALVAGAFAGAWVDPPPALALAMLPLLVVAAGVAWRHGAARITVIVLGVGFALCALVLATHDRNRALDTSLRAVLDGAVGGFDLNRVEAPRPHTPIALRAVLIDDASAGDGFVTLRVRARQVFVAHAWHDVDGGVTIAVGGAVAAERVDRWRAGRSIVAPVTFRRAARYLNDGVGDFERDLALDGTTLLASVKSGLLVEVLAPGTALNELAGTVRAAVRSAVRRWVGPHGAVSAGIVNAVLIGDRTGLPDDVTERLQAAGTYHVIAISGGNVAILTGLVLGLASLAGLRGRSGSALTAGAIVGYASIVTAGPSVWRATSMAGTYLAARVLDLRAPPWQAVALAAGAMAAVQPLDASSVGYALTFGATLALLHAVRMGAAIGATLGARPRAGEAVMVGGNIVRRTLTWVAVALLSTAAVEVMLLPVAAYVFSRVTAAGLLLNLVAIPAMGLVEVAGLLVVLLPWASAVAGPSGWVAHVASASLVGSAKLVELAPWLTARVPPPSVAVLACYYLALAGIWASRRQSARWGSVAMLATAMACIVTGVPLRSSVPLPAAGSLRWTIFDIGQGDGMLLEFPDRHRVVLDTGGAPFGARGFDLGARVLAPALWARGIRALDVVLLTHGDPDHAGGAQALLEDFEVEALWDGVDVPGSPLLRDVGRLAHRLGTRRRSLRAGDAWSWGGVAVRVLHPPAPDWQRVRVRNDDSVVLELVYGDVAVVLTGDVGAEVERSIAGSLTPSRVRVLKVAHHGSRTSTSEALLDAWRPQVAVISCGRGNTFGHPAPDVVRRLEARGIQIWRTDRDGQVTVDTDGRALSIAGYVGRRAEVLPGA